ncbi:uncharacterized protein L201_001881 [Kwoniella dendrophila CBS 6074]|uniref:Uncharacterized protein n=1 Tax=Kwoniella dendrophila CBS 6074 TaxID=1295534 RepID=A0AAX4JNQ3_9TREE
MTVDSTSSNPSSSSSSSTTTTTTTTMKPSSDIRLYKNRASYSIKSILDIFYENPVAHVAFIHPGDIDNEGGGRKETIMNVPLITVIIPEDEYGDEDDLQNYSVYLHTHKHSGLVEAVTNGKHGITATTTKIDGLIFSPTAHDHSLNYRSGTIHLDQGMILNDEIDGKDHEEKKKVLSFVTNTVTGYNRIASVNEPEDNSIKRTTIIKFKILNFSCKQRFGGFNGSKEPEFNIPKGKENDNFTGVIPCWTQFGKPLGYGKDLKEINELIENRSKKNQQFAENVAWANENVKLDRLGEKRLLQ